MTIEEKLKELQALAEQIAPIQEAKSCKESDDEEDKEDEEEMSDDGDDSDIENDDESKKGMTEKKKAMKESEVKQVEESKIDLGNLFAGEELSEEFKAKATAVFESAVALRVKQELAQLQEGFEKQIMNESVELKESLVDKVDGYLDYMVEQWMEKNELAINRGIKTEILESFVSGMKGLFESHYIDVPDEKYDLVEAKQEEVQTLEQRLDEQTEVIITLQKEIKEMNRKGQIDEACKDMADTDAERFRQLAEELTFTDSKEFAGKLNAIVESYFAVGVSAEPAKKVLAEEFMTDAPVEVLEESTKETVDPLMAKYLKAIEKSGF